MTACCENSPSPMDTDATFASIFVFITNLLSHQEPSCDYHTEFITIQAITIDRLEKLHDQIYRMFGDTLHEHSSIGECNVVRHFKHKFEKLQTMYATGVKYHHDICKFNTSYGCPQYIALLQSHILDDDAKFAALCDLLPESEILPSPNSLAADEIHSTWCKFCKHACLTVRVYNTIVSHFCDAVDDFLTTMSSA